MTSTAQPDQPTKDDELKKAEAEFAKTIHKMKNLARKVEAEVYEATGHHIGTSSTGARAVTHQPAERNELKRLHGWAKPNDYNSWANMVQRCYNPRNNAYKYYGGKGVTVCESWRNSYRAFSEDMGAKPSEAHSLDRIDPYGNYEPTNCRWADRSLQQHNIRTKAASKFRGVYADRKRFRAWITKDGVRYNLGSHRTPEDAYQAYLIKERELYG